MDLTMPRYFFNTRIGDELIADPEGEELRNPDRAWEVARAMIRELLKTEGAERSVLNAILEVTDDDGEIVLEFPFAEAISICPMSRRRGTDGRSDARTARSPAAGFPPRAVAVHMTNDVSDCASAKNIGDCGPGKPAAPARVRPRHDRLPPRGGHR